MKTYCVNVELLDWSKFAARIDGVSDVKWHSGICLIDRKPNETFVHILSGVVLATSESANSTELTPQEFIAKCAELCPKKSIYDELEPGDLCFVRDDNGWESRFYKGNFGFVVFESSIKDKGIPGKRWKHVIPTGKNIRDYPELEASDKYLDCIKSQAHWDLKFWRLPRKPKKAPLKYST